MNITVIGGGNVGTIMAAEMAEKGHRVTMYTSKPQLWSNELEVYDVNEKLLFKGKLENITNSMETAMRDAEYIWIVMPAETFDDLAVKMLPYAKQGMKIGVVPGSGGAEFAFKKLINCGCTLFGFQRVHAIARLKKYGKSSYMLGRKNGLSIGAIAASQVKEICSTVSELFDMPCEPLNNYLSVTLTPSNPILHTTRLYSMFKDYHKGVYYPDNILFYEKWDDSSSEMLIACDKELQELCSVIPLDLSNVLSLREYYESPTVGAMTNKICSIKAFKGLTSPMIKMDEGWIPDFQSRYFTTDFPFGLKVIKEIAEKFEVPTPSMNRVWKWYKEDVMDVKQKCFHMELKCDEIIELYK